MNHLLYLFTYPYGLIWFGMFIGFAVDWMGTVYLWAGADQESNDYLRESFLDHYNDTIDNIPWVGMLYYTDHPDGSYSLRWKAFLSAMNLVSINCGSLCAMLYFGYSIVKVLKDPNFGMSKKSKKMQVQLFKVLAIQTIIPCCCNYTPVGMLFICPLLGIDLGEYTNGIALLVSLYPFLDPIVVLCLVSDYRHAIMKRLCRRRRRLSTSTNPNCISHACDTAFSTTRRQPINTIQQNAYMSSTVKIQSGI
ncbi:hypothetical protein WR25_23288 [Diploscapter pachys]|uniref:7TM GPCR serpentine receptor class x (Srx) domain-containing protein n=1 Tax=Diploscapter pachys TaxID=2018661 RepID=A0A2A2J7B0_9BILA|nr:hypothetical protein WR25_23288 [Diploscapter pachys]